MRYSITVNGKARTVDAPAEMPLLWVLRDELNHKGTKYGCGVGLCGACTVHVDGQAVRACQTPIESVGKQKVTTIEAMAADPVGARVQKAWLDLDVMQCGYCQAGQIMSATALLKTTPNPSDEEISAGMAGNICRCGTYNRIREAIRQAAGQKAAAGWVETTNVA